MKLCKNTVLPLPMNAPAAAQLLRTLAEEDEEGHVAERVYVQRSQVAQRGEEEQYLGVIDGSPLPALV